MIKLVSRLWVWLCDISCCVLRQCSIFVTNNDNVRRRQRTNVHRPPLAACYSSRSGQEMWHVSRDHCIVTTHTSECSYLGVMLWQVLRWIKQNIEGSLVDYFQIIKTRYQSARQFLACKKVKDTIASSSNNSPSHTLDWLVVVQADVDLRRDCKIEWLCIIRCAYVHESTVHPSDVSWLQTPAELLSCLLMANTYHICDKLVFEKLSAVQDRDTTPQCKVELQTKVGKISQAQRRPLLETSPGRKGLVALSHSRI